MLVREPFGYLLTVDLYNVSPTLLDDVSKCYTFLDNLVVFLKMHKACNPIVMKGDTDLYPVKGTGLSAWIALIESGIQFHSVSARNFLSLDIYSCSPFDYSDVARFVWHNYRPGEIFNEAELEINFIERGLRYNDIHS